MTNQGKNQAYIPDTISMLNAEIERLSGIVEDLRTNNKVLKHDVHALTMQRDSFYQELCINACDSHQVWNGSRWVCDLKPECDERNAHLLGRKQVFCSACGLEGYESRTDA